MKTLQAEVSARPVVREARFSDYESIAALQKRNGLATKSCEDWIALWRENPAYQSLGGRWSIGWTLETAAGEIVGFIACIPVVYRFRGREIRAAVTGSWVTDPLYRGYSFAVLNAVARQTDIERLLTNTASPKAEPCMRLLRWSKLPVPGWDRSYFWITNYRGFAESLLKIYSIPAARAVACALGPILYCRDTARTI